MKKRLIAALLSVLIICSVMGTAQAAGSPAGRFAPIYTYTSGQFSDVNTAAWYAMYIQAGVEYGLINGKGGGLYAPSDSLTTGEAVKIADTLYSVYKTGKAFTPTAGSAPWYKPYADYALKKGILDAPAADYSAPVTRAQFAELLAKALPESAIPAMNAIGDNTIPDVSGDDTFGKAVYLLYRAGILGGYDSFGTCRPFACLTRAEAAAIAVRAAAAEFRTSLTLPQELSAADIFKKSNDAVFYLERYDSEGDLLGIGSGFFITRDGLAVTNYHVVKGASSAAITTSDGKRYDVKGICGYDDNTDLAILQIDGTGFTYLPLADSDALVFGTGVFAIGSPFGLVNTISEGIVSNTSRLINGGPFFQFSAPISVGSGGGPVLNTLGQVVGVTCLTVRTGQMLNFAVPINALQGLSRTDSTPLIVLASKNHDTIWYYKSSYPVTDYGVFTGTPLYKARYDVTTNVKTFYYKESAITVGNEIAVDGYVKQLTQSGFVWKSSYTNNNGYTVDVYYNADYGQRVMFGKDVLDGIVCRAVGIAYSNS